MICLREGRAMASYRSAAEIGTGGARTLTRRFYLSDEVFGREQERIFTRRWVCVGRESQIPQPGDYFVREVAGESLIVIRDRERGDVRAFFNLCRHRGTRICMETKGRFANTIQCPYHAWTYGLDGRLVGAPSMEGAPDFDKAEYPLHAATSATWEGFILVSLAERPEPFESAFAPLIGKFSAYNLPLLKTHRRIDYDVAANWKLIFENYSECYHCPTVHPQLVKLSPADSGENDLSEGPFLGGFMTIPSGGGLATSGRACAVPVGDFTPEESQRVYYYSLFPNLLLSLHADYVMVHTLWPQSPGRTLIECEWLFHPEAAGRPGFNPDDGVGFWDVTNRQDWEMCERSQLGVASRAYSPGPYSPREAISAAFDREYLRAIGVEG
jgi:Rieske 2Fe-2S family protein